MNIVIRNAKKNDIADIYKLISILSEREFDKEKFKKIFTLNLLDKNIYYLVAQSDSLTVGFIALHIHGHLHHASLVAEITELVVLPPYRNLKIGKMLLDESEKIASKMGCELIELATNKKRIEAHRFYEKNGFVNTHYKLVKTLDTATK